ncbi:Rieske (2Fe-2S) protein [Streptacidiphilus pinicola]|uniref:Rieske (2Fe-2S) protein n=1 Tax=Streptacidiphilus pinicola TaxID=2219663 RepID=A0A2X0JWF7_9ACTN|nr:Rieske (2Fe-2S) protein [Streptacidiphilus pinicola]RAG81275.1 Rieske (2Fe-2S) protein [Streptacidiphilus pinicola]
MRRQAVDRYVDRLLGRSRPKPFSATEDELALVRTAIDLAAAGPDAHGPSPAFVDRLRNQLSEREQTQEATPEPRPAWRTPPRRRFLAAGALTATGALAGAAADQLLQDRGQSAQAQQPAASDELVPVTGTWQQVAQTTELPEGAVVAFDLGTVTGFVRRTGGRLRAVSGNCTHQGCRLDLDPNRDKLACPCHGATFSLSGINLTRPHPGAPLPALPRLPVREQGGTVQVYAPAAGEPPQPAA